MNYDVYYSDPYEDEEDYMFECLMRDKREEVLGKLSNIELAALHEDIQEFILRYKEEIAENQIRFDLD